MVGSLTSTKTINQVNRPNLHIAETGTVLGRGVFAACSFSPGEVVEICPVVLLDLKTQPFPRQIRRLVYNWSKTQVALALGYGSLYNHHDQPNLTFKRNTTNQTITFSARRQIQPGAQLTISYDFLGDGKNPREQSWFEIHQVEKISNGSKSNGNINQFILEEK